MHREARQLQGRLAIIRERRAQRQTVPSNRLGFLILTCAQAPFNLAHAAGVLLELSLGMAIGLGDGLGCFFEIMELAQLVRNTRQDLLHSQANRALSIRNHGVDRHRQRLLDLTQQVSQVLVSSTVETAGKQDFT